jgi:hypothetical protein
MMATDHLKEVRDRLKANKLTQEDIHFLLGLTAKATEEGLGEQVGGKRVVARLPHGMDVVK